jgi:M6 family metalloprotease-like protein
MKRKVNKKLFLYTIPAFFASIALVLGFAFAGGVGNNEQLNPYGGDDYKLQLTADNAPTFSGTGYGSATKQVRYVNMKYTSAKASTGNHVELGPTGTLYNNNTGTVADPSTGDEKTQITSINSITVNYTTSGTLSLSISRDGVTYTSASLVSGTTTYTSSHPYYFKLTSDGTNLVTITSAIITYSCTATPTKSVSSLAAVESSTNYVVGDIYLNKKAIVVTATYSDSSTEILNYNSNNIDGYSLYCLDPDGSEFSVNSAFVKTGDYLLEAVYYDVHSDTITLTVSNGSVTENGTITCAATATSDSTNSALSISTSTFTYDNITVSSVTGSGYISYNAPKLRMSSGSNTGSLSFTLSEAKLITNIVANVTQYNTKTPTVTMTANGDSSSKTAVMSSGLTQLTFDFSSDTTEGTTITFSTPSGGQIYLVSLVLTMTGGTPVAVTGITLDQATASVGQGSTITLTAGVVPTNATNKSINWVSAAPATATVLSGVVTGVATGTVVITATTADGGYSKSCTVTVTAATWNNYKTPSEVTYKSGMATYNDLSKVSRYGSDVASATGTYNILVVPLAFTDSTMDTTTVRDDINTAYNGTAAQTGWESVHSYFYEASYHKLNVSATVAPTWYQYSKSSSDLGTDSDTSKTITAVNAAVSWYKSTYSSTCTEFDSDSNGLIDCVCVVYAAKDYSTAGSSNDNLWAYTYWAGGTPNKNSPVADTFFWASYDFMYSSGGQGSSYISIDAHTFIHEYGHAMGLNDYYNYDSSSSVKAAGGFDMQDYNVGDHNPFSKMVFGWSKPYVVTGGNAEITITPAATNENQYILIPSGGYDSWNKSAFDEYLVLELYTPTGMNKFDSDHATYSGYPQGPSTPGIRLYHIDSRLYTFTKSTGNPNTTRGYADSITDTTYTYDVAATNTTSGGSFYTDVVEARSFHQVHLLSRSGTDRMCNGGTFAAQDLFVTGDTFTMANFSSYFPNAGYMDEKSGSTYTEALGYSITIVSASATNATIRIVKL